MKVIKVEDQNLESEICESILRSLPFGIESAIVNYVKDVRGMDTWVVYKVDSAIGFISINKHFPQTAEIHVMGIRQEFHRQGIAHQLIDVVENSLRKNSVKFLTVKTLSESRPNKEYDQTRSFYLNRGFLPLEEFKTLWDGSNPCLFLVKVL